MCFGGGGGDGGLAASTAQEDKRQVAIASGMDSIDSAFKGFDQPFYDGVKKSYTDFAQPQLDRQWGDAKEQLGYALDRAGIRNSSAAGRAQADAQYQHDQAEQSLTDTAQQTATGVQGQVQGARTAVTGQLNADANAGEAQSNAIAQSNLLGIKPTFSPIGNLFQNLTGNLSLYAQGYPLIGTAGYSGPTGIGAPAGGASVFNSGGSGVVTR
jgi:hypothetical protein